MEFVKGKKWKGVEKPKISLKFLVKEGLENKDRGYSFATGHFKNTWVIRARAVATPTNKFALRFWSSQKFYSTSLWEYLLASGATIY